MISRKAFTLSEILVTIMILGVIAAFTLPILLKSLTGKETAAWKLAYSLLSSSSTKITVEESIAFKNLCTDNNHDCLRDEFAKYMSVIKSCDSGSVSGICWHNTESKYLNGSAVPTNDNKSAFVLNNRMLVTFFYETANCSSMKGTLPVCGYAEVDVNGFKSPNVWGRDIFGVWITDRGIKPFGTQGDNYEGSCSSASSGMGCGAVLLSGGNLP